MASFFLFAFACYCYIVVNDGFPLPASCPELQFGSIPKDHLFHTKKKPLIIAHRGQPMKYQENTLDGILSAVEMKADGFELDIYKTKDDKLVVIHDDDTSRMTGVSGLIWERTYEELHQLNLNTKIIAGGKTYTFDKPRKIPLLEDVLKATKHTDLVHLLEMKPSEPRPNDEKLTEQTSKLVAEMITKMDLTHRAILISFDIRKVHGVKSHNSNITVGTLFKSNYITTPKPTSQMIATFPKYKQCFLDAPNDTIGYFNFVLKSGLPFKLSGSSSFDCNINLYNNKKFSNNTIAMMRTNYSPDISTGFYTVYSMSNKESENKVNEKQVTQLLKEGGGERLITDNVPRLRRFLNREQLDPESNFRDIIP